MNIVESTQSYETWLSDQTDLQNKGLEKKHDQMAFCAFPFLRSTFYRWVQRWRKECSDLYERDEDVLLTAGDLHVENFGIWRDSRERLVWGVNDFDEACQLPFTIDLVRLATSIILAAEAVKIEAPIDKVTDLLITGYEEGVKAGGRPILLEEGDYHELLGFVSAVKEAPAIFWARKLEDDNNPEISAKELPNWLEEIFSSTFPRGGKLAFRREKRPGGLGSLGRRRYIAVLRKVAINTSLARRKRSFLPPCPGCRSGPPPSR